MNNMKIRIKKMIIITLSNMEMINMIVATNKIKEKEVIIILMNVFILLGFNFEAFNEEAIESFQKNGHVTICLFHIDQDV